MPITRNLDRPFAELALELLPAETVASVACRVADRLMLVVAQMLDRFGIQRTLDPLPGQCLRMPSAPIRSSGLL